MRITTLPVYSKLADPATIPSEIVQRLPPEWQLSQHQLETFYALCDPDARVVINTAMTGDGKSLAGLLPLLTKPGHNGTLALFPTNELILDQLRSAGHTLPAWGRHADWAGALYGARLDELALTVEELKRPELLLRELNLHRLTLSNPDILHAILQFHYQQHGRAPAHVASQLAMIFEQLTFDEFHIFETPQVIAVLTGLLFLLTQQPTLKTLFLSGTPSLEVQNLLTGVGLDGGLRLIEPQQAGWYHHGDDPGPGWRPILQQSDISFAPTSAEAWIENGVAEVLLPWFRAHGKGARAAMIVNSAATALRLVERLKPLMAAAGLSVEPNTGITGRAVRAGSYQADLLVGTSTVDVGVDFRINLLIFESSGAGTFLQRLGRLGRHTRYTARDGAEHAFTAFAAHALVPAFIYERLTQAAPGHAPPLANGAAYTREQLSSVITQHFPQPVQFREYTKTWGRFVPAKVFQTLSRKELRASFGPVREQLKQQYYDLTRVSIVKACREWELYDQNGEGLLVREAQSFRGGSPFDCGVLKEDERELVTYDLFWLLAHAELELLSREAFCAAARRLGKPETPYRRGFHKCFFRWRGLRSESERVRIVLGPRVARWGPERQQTAQILPGIQLDCAGHEFITRLNRALLDDPCVGLIVPAQEPEQLRRARYLPPGIQLLPYSADSLDAGVQSGTVSFGRDALLLDSLFRTKPLRAASDAPMIL
jgi:CRISPR-associated endonuclease/helicase Cas3